MGRHKKIVSEKEKVALKTKIEDLDNETFEKVFGIIQECLQSGVKSRTKIQKKIINLIGIVIATRQITSLIVDIENKLDIVEVLSKYKSVNGLKSVIQEATEKLQSKKTFNVVGLDVRRVQDFMETIGLDKNEVECNEQKETLNKLWEELDQIQQGDTKPTPQQKFALENKIAIVDLQQKNTKNRIQIASERIKALSEGIKIKAVSLSDNSSDAVNDCEEEAKRNFIDFDGYLKEEN